MVQSALKLIVLYFLFAELSFGLQAILSVLQQVCHQDVYTAIT